MASSSNKTANLLNYISKRYATVTRSAQQKTEKPIKKLPLQKEALKVTKLSNGIVVATLENHSPLTRLSAVVNAGARHESYDEQGASHYLRICSSLGTKNFSAYGIGRTLDHLGANFTVTSGRDQTSYNLVATRENFERAAAVLAEVVSVPLLRAWEVQDARNRLELDLELYNESPELRIGDYIHRAAFRNGLSNPLYASQLRLGNFNADTLINFRAQNFSADRLALVGVGIKHENAVRFAERFKLPSSGSAQPEASRYLGTEIREETADDLVHIAVASEGAGLSSADALASAIANYALGTEPRIKWSSGGSRLARTCQPLASEPSLVSSFNLNYAETGLFGFNIVAHKNDAGKILKGVFKECVKVSKNGFTNDEITAAKNNLKASIGMSMESTLKLIESVGANTNNATSVANFDELSKAIDAVPANTVNSFAKRVFTSKASMAAIGDLSTVPRLDELNA